MSFESLGSPLEWGIVLLTLIGMIYTGQVIKNEKKAAISNGVTFKIKGFSFVAPPWWGLSKNEENCIKFERQDTRYDWIATFQWIEKTEEIDLESFFVKHLQEKEIIFDPDTTVYSKKDLKTTLLAEFDQYDIVRIEGTATQFASERKYIDAFMIEDLENGGYLLCESLSSVLNGSVEGPFFEEVVHNLEFSKETINA